MNAGDINDIIQVLIHTQCLIKNGSLKDLSSDEEGSLCFRLISNAGMNNQSPILRLKNYY